MEPSSREPKYVYFHFSSTKDWHTAAKTLGLLQLLWDEVPELLPKRIEILGRRYQFEPQAFGSIAEKVEKGPTSHSLNYDRRRSPRNWLLMMPHFREDKRLNSLILAVDVQFVHQPNAVERVLRLGRKLAEWAEAAHGYICHGDEEEAVNRTADDKAEGHRPEQCLPGVYWANFFGPLYVHWFGSDKFLSCPAHHKEELSDGAWLILSSPSPLDWERPEAQVMEASIRRHLEGPWTFLCGAAFFDPQHPKRRYRTPRFHFEQPSRGPSVPFQAVVARNPVDLPPEDSPPDDPLDFIAVAAVLAEDLKRHFRKKGNSLDYSRESLRLLDDYILARSRRQPDPFDIEDGGGLVKRLAAYYGEVLRSNLGGVWVVATPEEPGIRLGPVGEEVTEYVRTRVLKLWLGRERADGLVVRYYLLSTGEWARVERYAAELANKT